MCYASPRFWGKCSAVALLLTLSSCDYSENPLSDPGESKPDEQLFGQWKRVNRDNGEQTHLVIGRPGPKLKGLPAGIMLAHVFGVTAKHELESDPEVNWVFSTAIGDDHYLNAIEVPASEEKGKQPVWNRANIKRFYLFKYKVSEGELTVWLMDEEAAIAAIKKGQLKGTLPKNILEGDTVLTDSTASLVKFFKEGGGKELFPEKGKKMVFSRVKW